MSLSTETSRNRYDQFVRAYRSGAADLDSAGQPAWRLWPPRPPRLYLHLLRQRSLDVAITLALSGVGIAVDLLWPLVAAHLTDHVIEGGAYSRTEQLRWLGLAGGGMALLLAGNAVVGWARNIHLQLLSSKLSFELRSKLFSRFLELPLERLEQIKSGGAVSRLSADVESTAGLLHSAVLTPLLASVRLLLTLAVTFTLDARLAGALSLALPLALWLQLRWTKQSRPIWRSLGEDRQEVDARVGEAILGIRTVRSFRGERRELRRFTLSHHTSLRKQLLATNAERSLGALWDWVMPMTQVVVVCFGGALVVLGEATLGTLIAFQGYLWRLLEPVLAIAGSLGETQRGLAALDRIIEVLALPADKPDAPDAVVAPREVRELRFESVSFTYPEVPAPLKGESAGAGTTESAPPSRRFPVLDHFTLRVPGGSVTALVGPSGAGKTTLVHLLARLNDPSRGALLLNGIDIRRMKLKTYRRLVGIVSQDVFLFDGSVRENLAYARPRATLDEIMDASRRANAHEFIMRLPNGYDTRIGERGLRLSGGQRQRLSIARALLADAKILILDEATSNLDSESEHLIQSALKEATRGRTTFIVAHRLSTITHADIIVVLDHGRVLEQGTHAELMGQGGLYSTMVNRQADSLAPAAQ